MKKKDTNWAKTRKFLNDAHLWIGLAIGLVVFVVCFCGTIYVFNDEIREAATPELYKVEQKAGQHVLSAEQLLAAVETASKGKVVSVRVPADAGRSWQFGVRKKEGDKKKGAHKSAGKPEGKESGKGKKGKEKGKTRPVVYYVNPYTAQILGNSKEVKSVTINFMTTIFSLHRWLLLDKIEKPIFGELDNRKLGGYITGASAILFTIGVLSGIALWVPRKIKSWKQGFKIKTSGSWKRTNHDLHNTLGFYACIFLFCMGSTGPQWGFDWYRTGLRKMLGTYTKESDEKEKKGPQSVIPGGETEKPLIADYLHAASQVLDYPGDYLLNLPADSSAALNISKTKIGFFAPAAADRIVMDQYTAKVIKTERFADLPFNQRVSGSIKAIHTGELYGMFTKIIYFFACLIATSLPVTGTLIWLNKMKKSKPKKAVPAGKRLEPAVI